MFCYTAEVQGGVVLGKQRNPQLLIKTVLTLHDWIPLALHVLQEEYCTMILAVSRRLLTTDYWIWSQASQLQICG